MAVLEVRGAVEAERLGPPREIAERGGIAMIENAEIVHGEVPLTGLPGLVEPRHRAQEPERVRVTRVAVDLARRPPLHDPPRVHDVDPVGHPGGIRGAVRESGLVLEPLDAVGEGRLDRDAPRVNQVFGPQVTRPPRHRAVQQYLAVRIPRRQFDVVDDRVVRIVWIQLTEGGYANRDAELTTAGGNTEAAKLSCSQASTGTPCVSRYSSVSPTSRIDFAPAHTTATEVLASSCRSAEMSKDSRAMAERIHAIVTAAVPSLVPKTYYGMPAYAREGKDGKVICFFKNKSKFKVRYSTFGFQPEASLDDGEMWPTEFAVIKLTPSVEARISDLVRKATG